MHRGFGGTAFEPAEERTDRELTLGPLSLTLLGLLLCGVCALCFVWGYAVGHRTPVPVQTAQAENPGPSAAQPLSREPKPQASESNSQPAAPPQTSADASSVPPAVIPATTSAPSGAAVVQAALPVQPASGLPNSAAAAVQPALGPGQWMVQIAAVSNPEDAEVLVSALRKRGYTVSGRRDPGDNLIHVQVGPFSSHSDAASMRQRLLNDGYNAIIEP